MAQLSIAPTDLETLDTPARLPRNKLAMGVGAAVFATLSVWAAFTSEGFLEADACTHYMIARFALTEPQNLVDVWGRPLCTGMYAVPAAIGKLMGVRVMSCLLAVACGLIGYRIARGQGYRLPALAAILLFAQPLFFLHSFSELTEIPFALVAVAALWAYQARNFLVMTILVSITPMGRPEGFGLMVMAALALVLHGRWYYLFLMPLPFVLWSYLGWLSWGSPADSPWYLWLKNNWPWAAKSAYGSGPWYHFIGSLPVLVSPIVFPALLVGAARSIAQGLGRAVDAEAKRRLGGIRFFHDHRARVQVMIAVIPLSILAVHSFLWANGLMASNGELRYLLCVAPVWALLCAKGWEWCWEKFALPAPFLCAGIAALAPVVLNMYWKIVPLVAYDDNYLAQDVAAWYARAPGLKRDYPKMMATLPMIYYAMDLSQRDEANAARWGPKEVKDAPPGTILIWDEIYGLHNADRNLCIGKEQVEAAGWIWIGNFVEGGAWCNVYLSPKTADGRETEHGKYRTPGN